MKIESSNRPLRHFEWLPALSCTLAKCGLFAVLLVIVGGFLVAQGIYSISGNPDRQPRRYDPKTPPPLGLPQAYELAMEYVKNATNQFWCVAASCQADWGLGTMTHWEMGFSNTNGDHTNVLVFFDKTVVRRNGAALVK